MLYKTQKQSVHLSIQPYVYLFIFLLARYLCITVIANALQSMSEEGGHSLHTATYVQVILVNLQFPSCY